MLAILYEIQMMFIQIQINSLNNKSIGFTYKICFLPLHDSVIKKTNSRFFPHSRIGRGNLLLYVRTL